MAQIFVNNFSTTLASGYTSGAATIVLASGTGVPNVAAPDFWLVTLEGGGNRTVLKVTSCSAGATTLNVDTTAYEGTGNNYSIGHTVEGRFTAASAANQVQQNFDYSYLGKYNSGGQARPLSGAGLAIGYNYNSGSREVDFWNIDTQASSYSFYWMQKTGTSSHVVLMYLQAGGTLVLPVNSAAGDGSGSLIVGSPTGNADGGICCYGGIYCINGVGTFLQGLVLAASKGITIPTGAPATTTNKVYVVSDTLAWNTHKMLRVDPRLQSVTSAATVTPDADANDAVIITAQAEALTLANPSGSPAQGQKLVVRIKDNGTARAISYGTQYRDMGNTKPTTTVLSKTLYLGLIFNSTDTKWDLVAVAQEA